MTACAYVDGKFQKFYEHQHECGGSNWPAVLPSDVVLAGRLMVKNIYIRDYSLDSDKANEKWVSILGFSY